MKLITCTDHKKQQPWGMRQENMWRQTAVIPLPAAALPHGGHTAVLPLPHVFRMQLCRLHRQAEHR